MDKRKNSERKKSEAKKRAVAIVRKIGENKSIVKGD